MALTSHTTKATTRAAVNVSPEPFSNWLVSLSEDGLAVFLVWFASAHPVLGLVLVLLLLVASVYIVLKLFRFLRSALRRLFHREPTPASRPS